MSQLNDPLQAFPQGQGDPEWQRLFDEATEMPPPGVWDAIERELDRDDDLRVIVVPFWGRTSTWIWSAAAAVVLLLLGWWSLRAVEPISPAPSKSIANAQLPSQSNTKRQESSADELNNPVTPKKAKAPQLASRSLPVQSVPTDQPVNVSSNNKRTSTDQPVSVALDNRPSSTNNIALSNKQSATEKTISEPVKSSGEVAVIGSPQPDQTGSDLPAQSAQTLILTPQTTESANALTTLDTRPMRLSRMYGTQRIVWFKPTETALADVRAKKEKQEHWASVSVMPSSFDPGLGLQNANVAYGNTFSQMSYASSARNSIPTLRSQADLSVAYQLSSGLQLSNRWSVETGVSYLEARSTVASPVQTIVYSMVASNRASNLYADALNNSRSNEKVNPPATSAPGTIGGGPGQIGSGGPTSGPSSADATISLLNPNVYDANRAQTLSNNYTFLQVPVQIGYQLRPRKRLGFTVLGGFLTNLFVRNTVNQELEVTNSDGIYRPFTLSASTGLRFRYRPTRRWSASMAGIFQQALQRGTRLGTDLTTRPRTMGVSVGLDYHF